jgi:AcrR family transcriptional regulator
MASRSGNSSTAAAKRERNRRRILAAAEKLFYERGFPATPLREIIRQSGLSTTVFYSLFRSKRDLLVELILPLSDEINSGLNAAFRESADDGDPIEKAIRIALEVYARHRTLTKIYVSEAAAQNLDARSPLREVMERSRAIVTNQLSVGIAKGYFRPVDPTIFSYSFIAVINMHLYRWAVLGEITRKHMLAGAGPLAQVFQSGRVRAGG